MATESSAWRFVPAKDDERKGAQIDLVIKRADKIIHLVEMKFSEAPSTRLLHLWALLVASTHL